MTSTNPARPATRVTFLLLLLCATAPFVLGGQEDDDGIDQDELEAMTDEIRLEVEDLRDAKFARPVAVAVTDREHFLEYARARMAKSTTPEELAADETVAKLLGLIPADMDLVAAFEELLQAQVGGFYDPEEEAFYLMSRFGGGLARVILAHELTHALDDQLYDLDGTLEGLEGNADAEFAYHAVVEGSGTAVMNAWTLDHLGEIDLKEMLEFDEMSSKGMEGTPPFLWKPLLGSYVRGNAFLNRSDKNVVVGAKMPKLGDFHAAFTAPPSSSEQILHPEKYWDPEQRDDPIPVGFDLESLPAGWEILGEDTHGEIGLGLVVEPPEDRGWKKGPLGPMTMKFTFDSTEGWGGDRYLLLGRGAARVVFCATAWDTAADAEEFLAAIQELIPHLERAATALDGEAGRGGAWARTGTGEREVVLCAWTGDIGDEELEAIGRIEPRIDWGQR